MSLRNISNPCRSRLRDRLKKEIREVILVLKIITYLTAWLLVILILYRQSIPVAALVGIGLYIISTLAIVKRGGERAK